MAQQIHHEHAGPFPKPIKKVKEVKRRSPASTKRGQWSRARKAYLEKQEQWGGWYECASCFKWFKKWDIEVDHVIKRSIAPDKVFDEDNYQLLCHPCHMRKDQGY